MERPLLTDGGWFWLILSSVLFTVGFAGENFGLASEHRAIEEVELDDQPEDRSDCLKDRDEPDILYPLRPRL